MARIPMYKVSLKHISLISLISFFLSFTWCKKETDSPLYQKRMEQNKFQPTNQQEELIIALKEKEYQEIQLLLNTLPKEIITLPVGFITIAYDRFRKNKYQDRRTVLHLAVKGALFTKDEYETLCEADPLLKGHKDSRISDFLQNIFYACTTANLSTKGTYLFNALFAIKQQIVPSKTCNCRNRTQCNCDKFGELAKALRKFKDQIEKTYRVYDSVEHRKCYAIFLATCKKENEGA